MAVKKKTWNDSAATDKVIAKVLGFEVVEAEDISAVLLKTEEGKEKLVGFITEEKNFVEPTANFSTRIEVALPHLFHYAEAHALEVDIKKKFTWQGSVKYTVRIQNKNTGHSALGYSNSLPLSICRALLNFDFGK